MQVRDPHTLLIRVTIFGSASLTVLAAALISAPKRLPGAALGSTLVLHVEWAVALFAALLLATVVLLRAWQGLLPVEVSGRGVKYAEAEKAQTAVEEFEDGLKVLKAEVENLRHDVTDLQIDDDEATLG